VSYDGVTHYRGFAKERTGVDMLLPTCAGD